jgi:hypothetical protein
MKIEKKPTGKATKKTVAATESGMNMDDLVSMYDKYEEQAKARVRGSSGVGSAVYAEVIEKVFSMGRDEISLAAIAAAIKEETGGRKVYNQLRSFVKGKSSPYELAEDAEGRVVIVRKKEVKKEE